MTLRELPADIREQSFWRDQSEHKQVTTAWELARRGGWSPCCGAGSRLPSERWSRAGCALCLTPSALTESRSTDRMLKGLKCHQNPSPIDTAHILFGLLIPKRLISPVKRQCEALLESWLPHLKKIRVGISPWLGGQTRTELMHPECLLSEQSPSIVGSPRAATTERSVLFPMLGSPREGLELPNCTPAADWRSSFYPLSRDIVKGIISTQHLKPEFPVTSDDRISLACIRFTLFRYCIKETLFLRNQKNKLSLWAGDDFDKQLYLWTRRALVFSMCLSLNLSVPGLFQLARNSDGLCWQPLAL